MREITTHHDGHGLTESIVVIAADESGPGYANHQYEFYAGHSDNTVGWLQFQRGPRNVETSTPGVIEGAVLAVLIDRLESFQSGPYPCAENEKALEALNEAMAWMKNRAHDRAARGVLGTNQV